MNTLFNALTVLILTPHIREYLQRTDPQALKQAQDAIGKYEATRDKLRLLVKTWPVKTGPKQDSK
jgi:hypothetical protein